MMSYLTRPAKSETEYEQVAMAGPFIKGGKKLVEKLIKEGDVKKGEAPKTDVEKVKTQKESFDQTEKELAKSGQIPVKDQTVKSQYKFTGRETEDDLYDLEEKGIITRDDHNVYSPRFLEYLDARVKYYYGYTKGQMNKILNQPARLNYLRAQVSPRWGEATFGDDYTRILEKARSEEINAMNPGQADKSGPFDHIFEKMYKPVRDDIEKAKDKLPGEDPLPTEKKRTLNAEGGVIGGGMIEGEDLGSRTGFADPDPVKLQKLKQLVDEANQSLEIPPRKIILYQKAGYKGTKARPKSEAKKILDTLIPSEKKVELAWDNFLNSSEDTLIFNMKNPVTKISEQTKMNVSKVSKILNKYDNYINNKDIVGKLKSVEFFKRIGNKNYTYGDLLDEINNKKVRAGLLGSTPEDKILNYALSHWEKNKGTGKSKVKFLNDPYSEDVRDWKFKYEGKTYTGDDVMRKGRSFKAFKEVYDLQDKIDSLKTETINFNGEEITKEDFFKRAYAKGTGKDYFYGRTPFDQDHIEGIKKDPFKNLRILPARINQGAGSIKQNADKFGNVEKALNKIGYNYDKSFEQLIEDETKLANDIFTKDRKLRSPYQIATETKSTEYSRPKRSKIPLGPEFDPQTGKLKKVVPGEGFAKVSKVPTLEIPTQDILKDAVSGRQVSANPLMQMLRVGAPTLPAIFGPTGIAGFTYALRPEGGYDLSDPLTRAGFELEAALAPTAVKGTSKAASYLAGGNQPLRRGIERLINLGMRAPTALKVARIASPIGILSLLGEGGYQFGKALQEEKARIAAMSPEERQRFEEEQTAAAYMGEAENFATGGRVGFEKGGSSSDKKKTTPALDKPKFEIDPNAPTDPSRRDFMEKGAGIGALGAAAATGLIKFGPEIKKAVTGVTTQFDQMPDIISELYFTIRNRGKITDYGRSENPVTTELGPYKLEEGPGGFSITKTTDSDYRYQQEYFEVQTDPEKGVIGYEELTVRPDLDGKLKDVDYGVELDTYREIGEDLAKIRGDDSFIKIADEDILKQIEKEEAYKEALKDIKPAGEND